MSDEYQAPAGKIWVCCACGKTATHRIDGPYGWDESCFLNAVLYPVDLLVRDQYGRVTQIKEAQS